MDYKKTLWKTHKTCYTNLHAFCSVTDMPRILMIDDDHDLLTITKRILEKKGFEIEVCFNGKNAFEKIRTFNPQLILLDVFINNADGLQICSKLKSSPFTRHIPVLVLSGYPQLAESAIYEFGADDFIPKPFEINEVISKVHNILSRKQHSV